MICDKAKKIAVDLDKKALAIEEETKFMEKYRLCPHCAGSVRFSKAWLASESVWKCDKCGLKRKELLSSTYY